MEASKKKALCAAETAGIGCTIMEKRKRPSDMILMGMIYLCAAISMFLVVGIVVYVFVR